MTCHGAASNFAGLMVLRVFLGVFESTISPGLSLVTGLWYKRSEHAARHGIWFAGNSISSALGGLLGFGIGHIHNSVDPWRVRARALIFGLKDQVWYILMEVVDFYNLWNHHLRIWHCLVHLSA
jgi:MFS family permease